MKKIALSALVIAASGAYVWSQAGTPPTRFWPVPTCRPAASSRRR